MSLGRCPPNQQQANVHFVERGIVSLVADARDGQQIETGLIGSEGLIGMPVLLGAHSIPNEARVQAAGLAYAVPVDAFREGNIATDVPNRRGMVIL